MRIDTTEEQREERRIQELMNLILQHAEDEGIEMKDVPPGEGKMLLKENGIVVAEVIEPVTVEEMFNWGNRGNLAYTKLSFSSEKHMDFAMTLNKVSKMVHSSTFNVFKEAMSSVAFASLPAMSAMTTESTKLMKEATSAIFAANNSEIKRHQKQFEDILNEVFKEEFEELLKSNLKQDLMQQETFKVPSFKVSNKPELNLENVKLQKYPSSEQIAQSLGAA